MNIEEIANKVARDFVAKKRYWFRDFDWKGWLSKHKAKAMKVALPAYERAIQTRLKGMDRESWDGAVVNGEIIVNGKEQITATVKPGYRDSTVQVPGLPERVALSRLFGHGVLENVLLKYLGRRTYETTIQVDFEGTTHPCKVRMIPKVFVRDKLVLTGEVINDRQVIESVPSLMVDASWDKAIRAVRSNFDEFLEGGGLDYGSKMPRKIDVDWSGYAASGDGWNEPREEAHVEINSLDPDEVVTKISADEVLEFCMGNDEEAAGAIIEAGKAGAVVGAALKGWGVHKITWSETIEFDGGSGWSSDKDETEWMVRVNKVDTDWVHLTATIEIDDGELASDIHENYDPY